MSGSGGADDNKAKDCIVCAGSRVQDEFGGSAEALAAIKDEVEAICQDAYSFAEDSPVPDPKELYDYVYSE